MLELPFLPELIAEAIQEIIVCVLQARFQTVPTEVEERLRPIEDQTTLKQLARWAATCPDVDAFRARLAP